MPDQENVTVNLVASPDDAGASSPEVEQALRQVNRALDDKGVVYSQRAMPSGSPDAAGHVVARYVIPLVQFMGPFVGRTLLSWVAGRAGRTLRLTVGDVASDANSQAEIDLFITNALSLDVQMAPPNKAV